MYDSCDRIIVFASVHDAIRAGKLLSEFGIEVQEMPTPREIDASCGQSLLFTAAKEGEVLAVLTAARARWAKLYRREAQNRVYEQLKEYEA